MMTGHARVATRSDVPELGFCVLLYEEDGLWIARSVDTSHVAEAKTPQAALRGLTRAIDAAVHAAGVAGLTIEQWRERQSAAEPRFVRRFLELVQRSNPVRETSPAPSGGFVMRATILRAA